MSQGYEEYKGLHVALVGLEMLRRRIPAVLTVGGPDPSHLKSPYGRLIRRMIRSLCLDDAVTFTGLLSEEEVASHLRSSAVFVLPSALENSPNSLAEAMMLGTPCVASYVGGVPDLLTHGVDGFLYPADAPYMLAHYLHEILTNATLAERLGEAGRRRARVRHNPELCTRRLLDIYGSIIADV